jgi:hypothetical protein
VRCLAAFPPMPQKLGMDGHTVSSTEGWQSWWGEANAFPKRSRKPA